MKWISSNWLTRHQWGKGTGLTYKILKKFWNWRRVVVQGLLKVCISHKKEGLDASWRSDETPRFSLFLHTCGAAPLPSLRKETKLRVCEPGAARYNCDSYISVTNWKYEGFTKTCLWKLQTPSLLSACFLHSVQEHRYPGRKWEDLLWKIRLDLHSQLDPLICSELLDHGNRQTTTSRSLKTCNDTSNRKKSTLEEASCAWKINSKFLERSSTHAWRPGCHQILF